MRLLITAPESHLNERTYILNVVLTEFLGLPFDLAYHDSGTVRITMQGSPGILEMPDLLFSLPQTEWRKKGSLPTEPLPRMRFGSNGADLPALYCSDGAASGLETGAQTIRLPLDIFGGCFYLFARYEELVASPEVLDEHGRFPARASLLHREKILERPLADEYVALLARCIEQLWPGSAERKTHYQPVVTHDIDHPLSTVGERMALVLRRSGGDLLRRRDPGMMLRRLYSYFGKDVANDPNNTFSWLMDQSENIGVSSRFHFMATSKARYDSGYDIGGKFMLKAFREISERGHEIGIHPSYRTSSEPHRFETEIRRLENAVLAAGLTDWSHYSRQHYLRWNARTTWSELAAIGITEDSSVGFADAAGFRCGTSRRFSVYDWISGQMLGLTELPLIVMDVTLTGKNYLHLKWEHALQKAVDLSAHCRLHGTPFTLLWHNDKVMSQYEKTRYMELLRAIA